MKKISKNLLSLIKAHKVWSAVILIILSYGGYKAYAAATSKAGVPQYTLAMATIGDIKQTVTGSGQVSAENQMDVVSKATGAVATIKVAVGDRVHAGDLLATLDTTDALRNLKSAQISLAKVTQAALPADVATAENSVAKSYSDGWNTVTGSFTDLQTVMTGMNNMLYGQNGFLGIARESSLNTTSQSYRSAAGISFDKANAKYAATLATYGKLTRNSSHADIEALISDTHDVVVSLSDALEKTRATISFIAVSQPDYYGSSLPSAQSSVNSWISTTNGDVSSLASAQSSILSSNNSLTDLQTGADDLTLQSAQISFEQAQETYNNYFIRAPFDGIVGRIPVTVDTQAGGSTVIATVIGDKKVSTISLNEVDAAKVKAGQAVSITFDAIDNFTAAGTVLSADLVGTVSQGVVAYNIKIAIDTEDDRIRTGMSMNATIVTEQKTGVLIVPSSAIKTRGNIKYVQTLATSTIAASITAQNPGATTGSGQFRNFGGNRTATSTAGFRTASSTGAYGAGFSTTTRAAFAGRTAVATSVSSTATPTEIIVTTGLSDDTNTEILSGLSPRQLVITKTVAGTGTSAAAAPSILNTLGGSRGGAAGNATFRTTTIGR